MEVIIDKREKCGVIPEILKDMGVKVSYQQVPVGDYLLYGDTAIERKTTEDFIKSLKDKRIFDQAKRLKNYKNPLIIIEGKDDLFSNSIDPNAVRGLLLSLYLDFNIPIIKTQNESETALWIYSIAKRNEKEKREINTRNGVKPKNEDELKLHAVSSLPDVGPGLSKKILKEYKTLRKVFSLREEELKCIPGLGDKKAKKITKGLYEDYCGK